MPAARQREALDLIGDRVFAVNAFGIAPGLLNKLGPDRWSHWGVNENFGIFTGPRLDYKATKRRSRSAWTTTAAEAYNVARSRARVSAV